MNESEIEDIFKDVFGLWINALFDGIRSRNPGITLEKQRQLFFFLIRYFLDSGRIKFCPPNEFYREGYEVWDAGTETILKYLEDRWPSDVESAKDSALNNYFFEIPAVLWVDEDGSLHGS